MVRFFTGDSLSAVVDSLLYAKQLSKDYNQMAMENMSDPLLQACYNLMGRSEDPLLFTGEVMNEDQFKESTRESDEQMHFFVVSLKMFLAIYMDAFDDKILLEFRKRDRGVVISFVHKYYIFFQGLVEANSARKSLLSHWRAQRYLRFLEKAMLRCPENHTNKVFFIKAELESSSGNKEHALLAYQKAIHYADKEGFLSAKALTGERAARMLLASGRLSEATTYFGKAVQLYAKWGATVKVVQLKSHCQGGPAEKTRFQRKARDGWETMPWQVEDSSLLVTRKSVWTRQEAKPYCSKLLLQRLETVSN